LAKGLVPCGNPGQSACTLCDFFVMFDNIVEFFLIKIVPALAALMIAIGGFIYIFSQGDPNMLAWSKQIFTSIVYGLLIIYGAFLILGVFFWFIGLNTWTTDIYHNWWQNGFFEINCP
jgi:hypothetical protein